MQIITLATPATLPHARVLARSLERHAPDWPLEVLLLDAAAGASAHARASAAAGASAAEAGGSLRVRSAAEVLDLDLAPLIARHEPADLMTLLVPVLLRRYRARREGPVLHLPATSWVLSDLLPVERALATRSVLLVPRVSADLPGDHLGPSQPALERAGRIDDAVMAMDDTPDAEGFLDWWVKRVEWALGSLDGRRRPARPEDRAWLARYLELAPARFWTAVLDDRGCNVSMWNLHAIELSEGAEGPVVDGQWPLRFMSLAGFDPDRPYQLAPEASRARVSRSPVLRELLVRYAEELRSTGWHDLARRGDVGRRLPNGLAYDDAMQRLYARALAFGEQFGDIFGEEGAGAFTAWLEGPAPWGAVQGINRYVFYRVAAERPDVVRAYPDLDGPDGAGYVDWCWTFGREETSIPDRFMPPAPDHHRPAAGAPAGSAATGAPAISAATGRPPGSAAAGPRPAARHRAGGEPAGGEVPAVRVSGYLNNTLGLGAAARGYVRALSAAGVSVSTISVPLHHLTMPDGLGAEYGRQGFDALSHAGGHAFEIVAVNADELPSFVERLGEEFFQGPRIGIWGWETSSIPARWRRAFALVEEIWVYSHFMAANIASVAPVTVTVLPPPVEAPATLAPPLRLGVPDGFMFLFVFDYLSTIQRKNPLGLIEAFKRAFAPGEGPQLLLKTINAPLRPLAEEAVLWAAEGRRDIHLADHSLDGSEMGRLMASCDCYVSLHRAEGFGLTLAEAMAIGKPVIGTRYSGNLDFMNEENSYLVDFTLAPVGPDCEIYPAEGEWAEPDLDHAARLMRAVWEAPREAAERGRLDQELVTRELSAMATGLRMRERLSELAAHGRAGASAELRV